MSEVEHRAGDAVLLAGLSVGSCDVSDACDRLGIAAAITGLLRPLWPECPAVSGSLRTVRLEPGAGTPLPALLEVLAGARDRVVLVDLRGRVDVQCWGTVIATAARRFGVRGALVNGAARDVEGLRELGFPSYARGVYPGAMRGRLEVVAVDEPVEIDGIGFEPGFFAVADASGLVCVPGERATEAVALALAMRAGEEEQLRAIASGGDPRAVLGAGEAAKEG
jgi:4-hydroxy-4-methyl-2-oxoglutarate aldolase